MAQNLTPQQNAATQKNVQSLLDARNNQVQVPTTKGTFHNTANGWVNTSAGSWSANPRLENYSVFSVKWGPARHAFTRQGETEQSIAGKSHLYMYFGVDRLLSRNIPNFSDMSHSNNMFSFGSVCPSYIILADTGWTTNPANWCVPLVPSMFEVNSAMVQGSQVDDGGYIEPPNAEAAYYTGWVETPWSNANLNSGYEMFASFWRCWDGAVGNIALVLYRGPYFNLPFLGNSTGSNMPNVEVVDPDDMESLETRPLYLTEVISEFYTIFDEIGTTHGIVGIAQGHNGSLQIETDLLNPPALALRGHLYAYAGTSFMIPAMVMPSEGVYSQTYGSEIWWTTDSLKYKGSNVFMRTSQLNAQEMIRIATGQYNWSNAISQTDGLLKFTIDNSLLGNTKRLLYLPQAGVVNPVGPSAQQDADSERKFGIVARVLLDKQKNLYFLQFWNTHPMAQNHEEPSIPADCTPTTSWFDWTALEQANYKDASGRYIGKSCLFRPTDGVVGRLEITDTVTDTDWSGWLHARVGNAFFSVDHNDELSGAGEGHSPWTRHLELYKFHDLEYKKSHVEDTDQYLVRHVEDGSAILQYAPLSSQYPPVDTQKELSVDQNSIDYADLSGDLYLQLYKFPDNERIDTKTALSSTTDVVLRHRYLSGNAPVVEVDYLSAGEVVNPVPDADTNGSRLYSLQKNGTSQASGKEKWELYKFHDQSYQTDLSSLTQGCAQFVVRNQWEDASTDAKVHYVPVSQVVATPDAEGVTSKSIERNTADGKSELRLYNFLSANEAYSSMSSKPTFKDLADDGYSVLIRDDDDGVGPQLKYFDLRYLSRYGDADIPGLRQSSIETEAAANALSAPYFQLADFTSPAAVDFNIVLKYDGKAYHATNNLSTSEDVQFVMRNALGGSRDVQYYDFTITAPKVGMSALTEEVVNELTSSHCDCGEKWVYISAVIDDISAQVSSLSGEYWPQGGDSNTCYGTSIGDRTKTAVINLNGKKLNGEWGVDDFNVDNTLDCSGEAIFYDNAQVFGDFEVMGNGQFDNDLVVNSMLQAGCIYANGPIAITGSGGVLQIGNTTLDETQLQQLLRLVN